MPMTKKDIKFLDRRRFLLGAGGVVLGLPLLESVGSGPALAQGATQPRAFLNFHCSSGVEAERFWPSLGTLSAASFANRGVAALADYAGRMLIPRGVHGYPVGTWTGHSEGTCQALTAAPLIDGRATSRSIDQLISQHLTGKEALVLRPGGRDLGVAEFNSISYTAPSQMATAESDPARVYRGMVGVAPPAPSGDPNAERLQLRRQSVIDLVRGEFNALKSVNLSAADKAKLEAHFTLIRDVELEMSGPGAAVACTLDSGTEAQLSAIDPATVEANANFPSMARLHAKLAALALACGYSRSVVLQWGAAVAGSPMYQWDGLSHQFRHHPISHGTTEDFGGADLSGWQDMLHEIDQWNISEFRTLLDLLDSYGETDGKTLLDNTLVLYSNEFSNGQGHTTGDLPLIVVGGGGYFKLGESIEIAPGGIAGVAEREGQSNRMLATILNSLGVPPEGFSDAPAAELAQLRA
jgi:Protein of unknown function (DUF1552)